MKRLIASPQLVKRSDERICRRRENHKSFSQTPLKGTCPSQLSARVTESKTRQPIRVVVKRSLYYQWCFFFNTNVQRKLKRCAGTVVRYGP